MLIWPRQLEAIKELAATGEVTQIELVTMPLSVQVSVFYRNGIITTKQLDQDGKERTLNEIFGY